MRGRTETIERVPFAPRLADRRIVERSASRYLLMAFGFFFVAATVITNAIGIGYSRRVFLGFVLVVLTIQVIAGLKVKKPPLMFYGYLLLGAIMAVGATFTRAPGYAIDKTVMFVAYYVVVGFMIINLVRDERGLRHLSYGLIAGAALLIGVLFIRLGDPVSVLMQASRWFRLTLGETGNPIMIGRYLGLGVIMFGWLFMRSRSLTVRSAAVAAAIVAFAYLVATGSKGPILALILGLLWGVWVVAKRPLVVASVMAAVIVGSFAWILSTLPEDFLSERYLQEDGIGSNRLPAWTFVLEEVPQAGLATIVLGHGTGDFGYVATGRDARQYPHNLILEVLYENGLFATALVIFCLGYPAWGVRRTFKDHEGYARSAVYMLCAAYGFGVVNAMFSADIGHNYMIPLFGYLLVAARHWWPEQRQWQSGAKPTSKAPSRELL